LRRVLYDVLLDGGGVGAHFLRGSTLLRRFHLVSRLYLSIIRTFTYTAPTTVQLGTTASPGLLVPTFDPVTDYPPLPRADQITALPPTGNGEFIYTAADDFIVLTVDPGGGVLTDGAIEWWLDVEPA